jgi:pyridoxal 5'-phosphate synthase pdxS subunit
MAKARIGHFMEARILEALGVDYIDESEVLTPADEEHHIEKTDFKVPFVCGARNLGEALRRIAEGAAMIRTKGEAGSGNIVEAVRHIRTIVKEMKQLTVLGKEELVHRGQEAAGAAGAGGVGGASTASCRPELLGGRHRHAGRCGAGDAARRGGGVRGIGHLQIVRPRGARQAIVMAAKNFDNPEKLLEASRALGEAMPGLDIAKMPESELLQTRGW